MSDIPQAVEYRMAKSGNVLFNVVVLVIMATLVGFAAWEARSAADRVQRATECIVEELSFHRVADRAAHQAFAGKLDAPYEDPEDHRPFPLLERLEQSCAPFTIER